MKTLIIGGYGFVGRHLAAHLVKCGDDIAITYRPDPNDKTQKLEDPTNRTPIPRTAQQLALDVTDRAAVESVISLLQPHAIYHLAAISSVAQAENELQLATDTNINGTINVLEAIRNHSPKSRFLFVSSAEIYGEPRPGSLPLAETAELRPVNVYGWTKAAADLAVFRYHKAYGLHTVRMRSFPHLGPGQSERFALSSFAKQIAAIKLEQAPPQLKVGNLEVKRDYTDVLDVVIGYREALENGKPGESYNICTGEPRSMSDLLQLMIKRAGVEVEIVQDPTRMRAVDVVLEYGNNQKALKDFGWKPRVDIEASIDTLLAYWLEALA